MHERWSAARRKPTAHAHCLRPPGTRKHSCWQPTLSLSMSHRSSTDGFAAKTKKAVTDRSTASYSYRRLALHHRHLLSLTHIALHAATRPPRTHTHTHTNWRHKLGHARKWPYDVFLISRKYSRVCRAWTVWWILRFTANWNKRENVTRKKTAASRSRTGMISDIMGNQRAVAK